MKITDESIYTQTLEKMAGLQKAIDSKRREFRKLETAMFEYQSTKVYSENRRISSMIQKIGTWKKEWNELKSTYGGKE